MMRPKAVLGLVCAAGLATALVGCAKSETPSASNDSTTTAAPANAGAKVNIIDGKRFDPATETVKPNQTVTWVNTSGSNHTVTASPGQPDATFTSDVLRTGDTYVFTPSKPGTYNYFCSIHGDSMSGVIQVNA